MDEKSDAASWIGEGEKYALVGMSVKADPMPFRQISSKLWVSAGAPFKLPSDWQNWIGSIRADEIEEFNLFLVSKIASKTPDLLDGENQELKNRVWRFYVGLLLTSKFAPAHDPVLLTGSCRGGEIGVRELQNLDCPIPGIIHPYPELLPQEIEFAARLAGNLEEFGAATLVGGNWRLNRTLHLYVETRTERDILERIHQYSRCIDGLILPDPGNVKKQFKSRTELFIGARHHDTMGEIYDARSVDEHLHENKYLESFDRATRLDLVKKEGIVEHIARGTLTRILADKTLWPHFANTSALAKFWALDAAQRQKIWGSPFDPLEALTDFDPQFINDAILGAH